MKHLLFINALLFSLLLMAGCSTSEPLPKPEPLEKDPLEAAREELFSEIGIEGNMDAKNTEELELPTVLPTPPTLPATDMEIY